MSSIPAKICQLPQPLRASTGLYYLVAAIYAFSLALPHAILTPLLLDKGLSFSDITFIQIGYSLAVFLCEVPSGILSDLFSRKLIYLASKIVIIFFFLLVLFAEDTAWLFLAWALYGLSAALDSGTIGNDVILNVRDHLAKYPDRRATFIDYLVRVDARIEGIFMLVGGAVGALLYSLIGLNLYWVSVTGSLICFVLILLFFPERKSEHLSSSAAGIRQGVSLTVRNGLSQMKGNKKVQIFILSLALTQVFFQTHFQLWQAFFLDMGFSSEHLGIFYVAFQLVSFAVSFFSLRKLQTTVPARKLSIVIFTVSTLCMTGLLIAATSGVSWGAMPLYFLFVAAFWLMVNDLNSRLRNDLDEHSLSTMTSFTSMTSRLAAMITLGLLTVALKLLPVTTVVPLAFSLAVMLIALVNRARHP